MKKPKPLLTIFRNNSIPNFPTILIERRSLQLNPINIMKTNRYPNLLAYALRKTLPLVALVALSSTAFAQPATLVAYWNFNDAGNPTQSVSTVGGFVGVFTNSVDIDPNNMTNNPVYTPDAGGFSGQPGDRALDFGTNQAFRQMRSTDIEAALNAAVGGDKLAVTFRQKWNTATVGSSSFWITSPSSSGNMRGFQGHVPFGGTTIYFDTAGCCTAGSQRLSGGVGGNYQQWRLYSFVKNVGTKQVWVDGTMALQGTGASPLPVDFTELLVGGAYVAAAAAPGVANNLRGVIDDFAVWQGALVPAQIALLNSGLTPPQVVADTDGDGMQNWYEDQYFFDKNSAADAALDADGDLLTNLQEYQKGTDPRNADTDADGFSDAVETGTGSWISSTDTGTSPFDPDTDDDLLLDGVENNNNVFGGASATGTNPHLWDTDGDGFGDGAEVPLGSNPVNPSSTPSVGTGSRILAYWNFDTNSAPTQAVDRVHGLLAVFTNGVVTLTNGQVVTTNGAVYTADGQGHTGQPGDRALDFGTNSAQRVVRSRAIAPYLQAASALDPVSSLSDQISISFWQKWSVVPVGSSSFWIVSPNPTMGGRGMQAHNPNGGAAGTIFFDTAGCCTVPLQRMSGTAPAGFNWQNWHHFAFIKNGITKQVWIDGKLVLTVDGANALPTDFTELILGTSYPNYAAQLLGLMDDVAIYGTALSTNQIEALAYGLSPMDVEQATGDADTDGMPDWWEDFFSFNKSSSADASLDADADGLTNLQEYQRKTDPRNVDTDADGLRDGVETGTGTWVSATDTGTDPLNPDADGDSLFDGVESNTGIFLNATNTGTNPFLTDTDSDLYTDSTEMLLGSNPVQLLSTPITPGAINLLAYWDFNNATVPTEAVDRIHNFVGVFEGGAAYTGDGAGHSGRPGDRAADFGANGTALVRNSVGQWLSATGPNDAATVSFWEKWTTPVVNSFAIYGVSPSSTGTSRGLSAHVPWGDGTVYFDSSGCCTAGLNRMNAHISTIVTQVPTYTDVNGFFVNAWHHVALLKNSSVKQIWIDGFLFLESVGADPLKMDFTEFLIGNDVTAATGFRGLMDDVAVYGSALDPTNIVALAQGASPIDFALPIVLSIGRSGASDVVLSWPGTGFILQTNSSVSNPAGWGDVSGATTSPVTTSLPPTGNSYFRLRRQ